MSGVTACLGQIDPLFQTANYVEVVVWGVIAVGVAVASFRRGGNARRHGVMAALVLVAFGISDAVETQTGAWWRPWWLLVWKGSCLAALLGIYLSYLRGKQR